MEILFQEAREEGEARGEERGKKLGEELGKEQALHQTIRNGLKMNFTVEQLMGLCNCSAEYVEQVWLSV